MVATSQYSLNIYFLMRTMGVFFEQTLEFDKSAKLGIYSDMALFSTLPSIWAMESSSIGDNWILQIISYKLFSFQ